MEVSAVVGSLGSVQLLMLTVGGVGAMLVLRAIVVREEDPWFGRVIIGGLVAKMFGAAARLYVMGDLYGGGGDFNAYLERGLALSPEIRSGTLPEEASETGTAFVEFVSGVVFTVAPPILIVGFVIFSLLAFSGAYLFFRAFQIALPDGDHRRYALLIFFMPTMVFWPSSIGKDAWLVFSLGLSAYGAARLLRRLRFAYLITVLGIAATFMVRPHIAALLTISLAGAYILRSRDRTVKRGSLAWLMGALVIGSGTVFVATNFAEELPQGRDPDEDASSIERIFAETSVRTSQGGSGFDSRPVKGPGDLAHALVTVPFRPFPWEGNNRQAQVAGLEGFFLLAVLAISLPRLRRWPREVLRRPFLAMASIYSLGFVVAFSNVGNFGLLARQRSQLLPFLFVLLALPRVGEKAAVVVRGRPVPGPVLSSLPAADEGSPAGETVTPRDSPTIDAPSPHTS